MQNIVKMVIGEEIFTRYRWLMLIMMVVLFAGLAGCAPRTASTATQSAHADSMPMEDPKPIIDQMKQTVDDISTKVKANQIAPAKQSGNSLMSLNDRLAPHLSDKAFQTNLHHAILALNDEVNKPTPNPVEVDTKAQSVKELLQQAAEKLMKM